MQGIDPAVTEADIQEARAFNAALVPMLAALPRIEALPAAEVRRARRAGNGSLPAPVFLPDATDITVGGRAGSIPVRVVRPDAEARGIYIHIHGGGHTLGAHDMQDVLLKAFANATGMVAASIGYRLAPEDPYPAGPNDCEDAALEIVRRGSALLDAPAVFAIGGESAGANLSLVTLLRLRDNHDAAGEISAANLVYGGYDLTGTPSVRLWSQDLILSQANIHWFTENYVAHVPLEERRAADISPLYAELSGLPPALFTVGTQDPLLDDSLFMAARWRAAGGVAELAVYPEGIHAFNAFPIAIARHANERQYEFVRRVAVEAGVTV